MMLEILKLVATFRLSSSVAAQASNQSQGQPRPSHPCSLPLHHRPWQRSSHRQLHHAQPPW